jgi:hypothetical protein
MSGRERGQGGRAGRLGHGHRNKGGSHTQSSKKSSMTATPRKVLGDYIYYIGSAKQASDFTIITQFIINHIRKSYTNGDDIGDALEEQVDTNMNNFMPILQVSTATDTDVQDRETKQFEMLFEAEIQAFITRKATYQSNTGKAFALFFGQCNKTLQNKLMSRTDYESTVK